jgi:carboxyl-terminal processing protease
MAGEGVTGMQRTIIWVASLILAALLGAAVTALLLIVPLRTSAAVNELPASLAQNRDFARFLAAYQDIRQETIWPNTPDQLINGAINGMVSTLHDQFSNYLPPQQFAQLNHQLGANFTGIGIALGETAGGRFQIVQVFSGTPAARSGLKPLEDIVAVNGKSVTGESATQVSEEIRGPAGTRLTLTVERGTVRHVVHLKRAVIDLPTVFTRVLPHRVGYMEITEFGYDTGTQVLRAYRQLMRDRVQGILLDLRDNPGGDLAQAQQAAGAFVPAGKLVTLEFKSGPSQVLDSKGPGTTLPVVVLVNGDTASAAEILSAAIQQRHVGILVGTRTYGKGIVQQLQRLPGGAYLKLTIAKYLTPNGDYIEHKGLTPNVVVTEPVGVVPSDQLSQDPQLRRAYQILLRRIVH